MPTTFETNDQNPFAAPIGLHGTAKQQSLSRPVRASERKLRAVNRLVMAAELSFIAGTCAFGLAAYFRGEETSEISMLVFWGTLIVFWYSVVAGLLRPNGNSVMVTPFLLPIPFLGTVAFLAAKEDIRKFMIANGYRPRVFGFSRDTDERKKLEQAPNYQPSQSTHLDGTQRRYIFSLSECWIGLCFVGILLFAVERYLNLAL